MDKNYNYTDIVSMIKEMLEDPLSGESESLASQIVDTVIGEVSSSDFVDAENVDISPDL